MSKIMTKPFKHWPVGTALTSDQDEFRAIARTARPGVGAVYVNAERMAQLEREGYFS